MMIYKRETANQWLVSTTDAEREVADLGFKHICSLSQEEITRGALAINVDEDEYCRMFLLKTVIELESKK